LSYWLRYLKTSIEIGFELNRREEPIVLGVVRTDGLNCAAATRSVERLLTAEEVYRRNRLKVPASQYRMVLVRWLVRQCLTQLSGMSETAWRFEYSPTGKPTAVSGEGESERRWQVSLSHCNTLLAAVVHPWLPLGIDVEHRDRNLSDGIIEFACTSAEQRELNRIRKDERQRAMLQVWTFKEAIAKCCDRVGLANLTKICSADLSRSQGAFVQASLWQSIFWDPTRFLASAIDSDPNHFVTLAIDQTGFDSNVRDRNSSPPEQPRAEPPAPWNVNVIDFTERVSRLGDD
jgi:phosphopantetheinyl transferase